MKKKMYVAPEVEVFVMEAEDHVLAGSLGSNDKPTGGTEDSDTGDGGTPGSGIWGPKN